MKLFIDTSRPAPTKQPPIGGIKTILNPQECHVWSVEVTLDGRLCYRPDGHFFRRFDIDHVIIINSSKDRNMHKNFAVQADFDIYTTDGRVIEVSTCARPLLEAALRYVPVEDPRARYRAARRVGGTV